MTEVSFPKEPSVRKPILEQAGCLQLSPNDKREALLILMAERGMKRHGHAFLEPEEVVREAVENHGSHLCIGWSGGKCSTVVLHMTLQYAPDVLVNYNNTGVEFPENVAYVHELARKWNLNFHELKPKTTFFACVKKYGFPQMRSRAFGKKWSELKKPKSGFQKDKKPMCCHLLKDSVAAEFHKSRGISGDLSGIRASESRVRAITVGQRGMIYTRKTPYPITVYLPIALWTTNKLDNYLRTNNIPANPVYETQVRNGCWPCTAYLSWEQSLQRYSPRMYRIIKKMRGEPLLEEWS